MGKKSCTTVFLCNPSWCARIQPQWKLAFRADGRQHTNIRWNVHPQKRHILSGISCPVPTTFTPPDFTLPLGRTSTRCRTTSGKQESAVAPQNKNGDENFSRVACRSINSVQQIQHKKPLSPRNVFEITRCGCFSFLVNGKHVERRPSSASPIFRPGEQRSADGTGWIWLCHDTLWICLHWY